MVLNGLGCVCWGEGLSAGQRNHVGCACMLTAVFMIQLTPWLHGREARACPNRHRAAMWFLCLFLSGECSVMRVGRNHEQRWELFELGGSQATWSPVRRPRLASQRLSELIWMPLFCYAGGWIVSSWAWSLAGNLPRGRGSCRHVDLRACGQSIPATGTHHASVVSCSVAFLASVWPFSRAFQASVFLVHTTGPLKLAHYDATKRATAPATADIDNKH